MGVLCYRHAAFKAPRSVQPPTIPSVVLRCSVVERGPGTCGGLQSLRTWLEGRERGQGVREGRG